MIPTAPEMVKARTIEAGVTIVFISVSCDTTNGTVTVAGNVADVSGVSCARGFGQWLSS